MPGTWGWVSRGWGEGFLRALAHLGAHGIIVTSAGEGAAQLRDLARGLVDGDHVPAGVRRAGVRKDGSPSSPHPTTQCGPAAHPAWTLSLVRDSIILVPRSYMVSISVVLRVSLPTLAP